VLLMMEAAITPGVTIQTADEKDLWPVQATHTLYP
jgi:hypothetical protein